MPRFFVDSPVAERALITGDDARHIADVLRMRPGESITLNDQAGWDYNCEIELAERSGVQVRVLEKRACETEPSIRVRLYQALPKSDKLEWIVQKAVELGVHEVVPVLTTRCVSRPDSKAMKKKLERLQKIAQEAAKQSGRGTIPSILPLCSFQEAIAGMKQADCSILLYEQADVPIREAMKMGAQTVALFVGSEGGFSLEEAQYARENGIPLVSLGKRILRCETAPICALSIVFYACGEI